MSESRIASDFDGGLNNGRPDEFVKQFFDTRIKRNALQFRNRQALHLVISNPFQNRIRRIGVQKNGRDANGFFDFLRNVRGCPTRGVIQHNVRVVREFRKRPEFLGFFSLIPSETCGIFSHSFCTGRHHHPAWSTRWTTFRCWRVRFDATPSPDSEPGAEAGSQPSDCGSHHCRFVHAPDASGACSAVGCRVEGPRLC